MGDQLGDFGDEHRVGASIDDFTVVVGLRAHGDNPWVLSRLRMLKEHYAPLPEVVVVDHGSVAPFFTHVRECCDELGFRLIHEVDDGPFSLARSRNLGAVAVRTGFVFFLDIDCWGPPSLFSDVSRVATAYGMDRFLDLVLTIPTYHLSEAATASLLDGHEAGARAADISEVLATAAYRPLGDEVEFVAPYSNVLACRRSFFDLVGGYDEGFVGHGGEDFEFLLRIARHSEQFPLPASVLDDRYGPTSVGFHAHDKAYAGFRRLFELMAAPAELSGLRVVHLHHPRVARSSAPSRSKLRTRAQRYVDDRSTLLACDWMPREHTTVAFVDRPGDEDYLLPLRWAGHRLVAAGSVGDVRRELGASGASHVAFVSRGRRDGADLQALAEERGLTTIEISVDVASGVARYGGSAGEPGGCSAGKVHDFRLGDVRVSGLRAGTSRRADLASYAAARLGISSGAERHRKVGTLPQKARKLYREPRQFLEESRFAPLRWLGRRL